LAGASPGDAVHHGIGGAPDQLLRARGRELLAGLELPAAAKERIEVALAMIAALGRRLAPLERDIRALARRQAGCQGLMGHYGVGPVTATSIVAELGDVSRLSASRKAVRCAGLDVGVHRSDQHSRLGKPTRQGSPQLRWALYEAAQSACKPQCSDHGDYLELKARGLSHTRATLTIARKLRAICEAKVKNDRVDSRTLGAERNYARLVFGDPSTRALHADWEEAAWETIALLRFAAARHPDDAALRALIAELRLHNDSAAHWWETHDVTQKRHGIKRYTHRMSAS
jgi:MmyB-like transcription regulator ligand binding domain/Transposase IS116/IS110/IS902 family